MTTSAAKLIGPYSRNRAYRWRATNYAWGVEALCGCGKAFMQLAQYDCCPVCYERRRLPLKGRSG